MKKAILSILAGLTLVGSAVALPSPEDLKALCDKYPDKYMWVEKTQACIPINPCTPDTPNDIKTAYCPDIWVVALPKDTETRNLIINRFVDKVMGTTVTEIKEIEGSMKRHTQGISFSFVGVKTKDNGYFAVPYGMTDEMLRCDSYINYAFETYGIKNYYGYGAMGDKHGFGSFDVPPEGSLCKDIKDFASRLSGELVEQHWENVDEGAKEPCVLVCKIKF